MSKHFILSAAAALLLPFAASAQDAFFDAVNQGSIDYAGTVAVNSALDPDAGAEDADNKASGATNPGTQFKPSGATSRQVRDIFLHAYRTRSPERRARYARQIESGWAQAPFEALLKRHQLASDDYADVASGYFIALWSVIHDRPVTATEAQGAIAQVRRVVLADPETLPSTDTARQIISEAYGIYAGLVLREHARRSDDPAASQRLRENVAARARAQGMDLSALDLTADGFRPMTATPVHAAGGN